MTQQKPHLPEPAKTPEPLVEDKGLPPVEQSKPMPPVKPPLKEEEK